MLGGVVAAGLLAFAGAIVLHVLAAAPGKRPSWSETFAWARGLLWAMPVLAVMALVVGRAAPRFQEPAAAQADPREALQIELNEPEGLNVEVDDTAADGATSDSAEPRPGKVKKLVRAAKDKVGQVLGKSDRAEDDDEWISTAVTKDKDATLVVLSSKEHATLADAEKEVLALAASRVRTDFEATHPTNVEWTVPAEALRFRRTFDETIDRQAGNVSFKMHKAHRQLELSDATRKIAFDSFRTEVVHQRLWGLGTILGMASVIAAGSALYLRLDARTHGQYRTRLKAATVAGLTAAGLLATSLV
jgi:hypothetical protein